ncbi:hypothetical protein B5M09_013347, partial [Aphanomyces astaci]
RLKQTVVADQEGAETQEEVLTAELAMDRPTWCDTMNGNWRRGKTEGESSRRNLVDLTRTPDSSYDDEREDERRNLDAKPKNKKLDYMAQAKRSMHTD